MYPLRILHTPVRAFPQIGGVELHVHNLANGLVQEGHHVEVVAAQPKKKENHSTQYQRTLLDWKFMITNTQITHALPLHLFRSQYDIVHSHIPTPWTSDWSMLIAKIQNKKKVITVHNDMKKEGFLAALITKLYIHTLMRVTLSIADRIILVNKEWERSFEFTKNILAPHKHKIQYIPNAVDLKLFSPNKKKVQQQILCVSVLDKHHVFKGIPYLLQAFRTVLQNYPNATLQIVGEGELKNVYQKLAQDLLIDKSVKFLGPATQSQLSEYYSQASVFVLPSTDTEGFGLVLLEALACETPVITTPIAGVVAEIRETHSGRVVPVKEPQAIAYEIGEYFKHPERIIKEGKNGRRMVEEKFSWKHVTDQTIALYRSL